MEDSILKSVKDNLGLGVDYTPFDLTIIMHINSAFTTITQLGIGPNVGFAIDDETGVWATLALPQIWLNAVKTFIFLKVRLLFDPPPTSFHITAIENQIRELEGRLSLMREVTVPIPPAVVVEEDL